MTVPDPIRPAPGVDAVDALARAVPSYTDQRDQVGDEVLGRLLVRVSRLERERQPRRRDLPAALFIGVGAAGGWLFLAAVLGAYLALHR